MEIASDALDYDFVFVDEQINGQEDFKYYYEDIKEPLRPGSCIVIRGKIQPECKRFAINFLCLRETREDIAFHFNPRLALRYVVRNTRINNSWGEEETTSIEKFHIERNKTFELQFVTTEQEFLVALGGRHICGYVYRMPLDKINRLQVEGFIDIDNIEHKQVEAYPVPSIQNAPFSVPTGSGIKDEVADQQLVVPITASLPKGFKRGWQLEITGRVKILPAAFYINLQVGDTLWPHPMIPLHLNPRFYTSYGNHLFVRNSWMNGEWGTEERTSGFQFTPGQKFHLAIRKHDKHFAVWVDGSMAGEFQFRTPADAIDTVYIHGDVQIFSIYMRNHIEDKYCTKSRHRSHRL